jgi:hypothetical protein
MAAPSIKTATHHMSLVRVRALPGVDAHLSGTVLQSGPRCSGRSCHLVRRGCVVRPVACHPSGGSGSRSIFGGDVTSDHGYGDEITSSGGGASRAKNGQRRAGHDHDGFRTDPVALEDMLQGALNQMQTAVWFYDDQWRLVFVNKVGRSLLGVQDVPPIGRTIWELNPTWGESSPFFEAIHRAASGQVVASVRAFSPAAGAWFETVTYPANGGVAIYSQDVTAEEDATRSLAETLRRLRRKADLLDASDDAVYLQELDDRVSY